MDSAAWVAAGVLTLIGIAHSVLGEHEILRPLFAERGWSLAFARKPTEVLLRAAWHFTSVAWFGLAAILCGASPGVTAAVVCLGSGLVFMVWLRGHLAWPLFALAGLAALRHEGWLPDWLVGATCALASAIAIAAALVHGYWAVGGERGLVGAVPQHGDGTPHFEPGPLACLAVALALVVFAGLLGWTWIGDEPGWVRVALGGAALLLCFRAVGDGRQVGFTKTDRETTFAQRDDRLFTPLVVGLLFGSLAALIG